MSFDGQAAWRHVETLVGLGNRCPGSPGHGAARTFISHHLAACGWTVEVQSFRAGPLLHAADMANVIARRKASGPLVLGTHYDTIRLRGRTFVGANDGGSGVGVLLEMARILPSDTPVALVFFDGEEALSGEEDGVGLYGSRRYVREYPQAATAVIIDMVGDPALRLCREAHSTPWLQNRIEQAAPGLMTGPPLALLDDHIPFLEAGIPAALLVDFGDGEGPGDYWHTERDTLDHVSVSSLQAVGNLLVNLVPLFAEVSHG
ncbi:MAG TPA: M28 family metallopeptidase [Candidatus Xenobia bacterium]